MTVTVQQTSCTEQSTHEGQVAHDAESNVHFIKLFSTVSITEYSMIRTRVHHKPDLDEENENRRDANLREAGFVLKSVVSGHAQTAELAINDAGDSVAAVDNTTAGRCSECFSSSTHLLMRSS